MGPNKNSTRFWESKSLDEMTEAEWESLCDGCGRCCLNKLEDVETGEIHFTNVACQLLDSESCQCSDYAHRRERVNTCLVLRPFDHDLLPSLPETCAYRRLAMNQELEDWHPLISGTKHTVRTAGISVCGKTVSEEFVHPDQLPDHIIEF